MSLVTPAEIAVRNTGDLSATNRTKETMMGKKSKAEGKQFSDGGGSLGEISGLGSFGLDSYQGQ